MTKDLLLQLDGSAADDLRLAAVDNLAQVFEAHVRGRFMNLLPHVVIPPEAGYAGGVCCTDRAVGVQGWLA